MRSVEHVMSLCAKMTDLSIIQCCLYLFSTHSQKIFPPIPHIEEPGLPVLLPCFFHYQKRTLFPYLRRCQTEKMKTLKKQHRPNGGIAWVYRSVLPTGQRGLFYNVLSLSPYLKLRERFPYLTHSCKSQLNSSNSENELQTRLLSIWAHGSCQDWAWRPPLSADLLASSPLSSAGTPSLLPSH